MANNDITARREKVTAYLNSRRLRDAFGELRAMTDKATPWEINDQISHAEEAYELMLRYLTNGVADPAQDEIYSNLVEETYGILDKVVRQKLLPDEPTLYYNTLRNQQSNPNETIPSLVSQYVQLCEESSLYNLITSQGENAATAKVTMEKRERLEMKMFNCIWVSFPLKADEEEAIDRVLESVSLPMHVKELMLSALFLGLLEFYDSRKLNLLLHAYQDLSDRLSAKALVEILLALCKYEYRIAGSKMLKSIEPVKYSTSWNRDVQMVYSELVHAIDTERINRAMNEEVISQMLKLRPDLYKKINDSMGIIDLTSIEENPEWEKLLDESGIADKLKELIELQEEGADVFMGTFAGLKSFPFFSDISNWFLPFHLDHSIISEVLGPESAVIGEIIAAAPMLCNSDKYSFMLSLKSIPAHEREMMLSQIEDSTSSAEGVVLSVQKLSVEEDRRHIINKYLLDLYRFFKLFRRKGEFHDPFASPNDMVKVELLSEELGDVGILTLSAEFYLKRKYFTEAFELFQRISEKAEPSSQLYQKMGYCLQKSNDIAGALRYYEKAELLNADSLWTLHRIAWCYRMLNSPAKALEYFLRLSSASPDDFGIDMNIGHCLHQLGRYKEAVKQYYKVEFLSDEPHKAWRPLAWCLFLSKDFKRSREYFDKILASSPKPEDYLNMGHLMFAIGEYNEAVGYYKSSIQADDGNCDNFIKSMNDDRKYLTVAGVDTSMVPLMIDAVLYRMHDNKNLQS